MKKPRIRVGAVFAFVLSLLLSFTAPVVASADMSNEAPGWPRHLLTDMTPTSMAAFSNDSLSFANCAYPAQANSFQYVYKGKTASTLPTATDSGVSCGSDAASFAPDGTFYTTWMVNTSNHSALTFVAEKNGRTLWQTDMSSKPTDPVCGPMSSWGADQYNARMSNVSIGSDGNIYGLVQPTASRCAMYLTKVDRTNGSILFKKLLNTDQSILPGDRLWVYGDKLLVMAQNGLLRQFGYDGTENTSAAYQFPLGALGTISSVYANADGRVFVVGTGDYSTASGAVIAYHDLDGTSGIVNSGLGVNPPVLYMPGAGGTFTATNSYGGSVTTYHISSAGITSTVAPALPSSASHPMVDDYWQDQNGNAIMVRQLFDNNWVSTGVTIDEIDGISGAITNLLLVGVDDAHPNPTLKAADISPDGYLYAVICHDNTACGNTSGSSLDGWVHKVRTTGFDSPIKNTGSFATYISTKLNYVAMGDSYSGGEGNPPFEASTNTSADQCHRSPYAYPWSVANNAVLNLKLVDFTACTGATVSSMESGQNGEPAQLNALNDDTKVITLTIGGNDVHFINYVEACTWACGPGTVPYANIMTEINADSFLSSLKTLYAAILTEAPNADVYVADYPYLAPQNAGSCAGFDLSGAYNVEQALNSQIALAVTQVSSGNSKLHFVEVNYSGSPFVGHDLCSGDASFFNGIVAPPNQVYSVHPNANGQSAYAAVFIPAIE